MMGPSTMGASLMSSTDSRTRRMRGSASGNSRMSKDGRCLSAPLLPASQSTHASTWYTTSTGSLTGASRERTLWKPLASSWRDWDSDEFGPVRKNVDDASAFREGCIPHWGKGGNMRKRQDLEHELTFAYYRTKRHNMHPHRAEVGDPILPQASVVVQMRSGKG